MAEKTYADQINDLSEGPEVDDFSLFDTGFRTARAAARCIAADADEEIAALKLELNSLLESATARMQSDMTDMNRLKTECAALRSAAVDVVSMIDGDLPVRGWLRDNAASRAALSKLRAALNHKEGQ